MTRAKTSVHRLPPERLAPLLRKVMPIGGEDLPLEVVGWRNNATGRWVRFRADYPNGFRLSFSLSRNNVATRISACVRLTVEPGQC